MWDSINFGFGLFKYLFYVLLYFTMSHWEKKTEKSRIYTSEIDHIKFMFTYENRREFI